MKPTDLGLPVDDLSGHRIAIAGGGLGIGAQVWLKRDGLEWGRIFLRRAGATRYEPVEDSPGEYSDVSLVGSDGPWLFFLRMIARPTPLGLGFDAGEVVRIDVRDGSSTRFPARAVAAGDRWIAALHGASASGLSVFATCGANREGLPFLLAEVSLPGGDVRGIFELTAVFL